MIFRKPVVIKKPLKMAKTATVEELLSLHAKRSAAIRKAGTRWLLHQANYVQRLK